MNAESRAEDVVTVLQRPESRRSSGFAALPGIKVLIVDDDDDTRELLADVLNRAGAEVTAASSAAEALAMLQRTTVDVLVSDIGMPDEDGYALIGKVRALGPTGERIPAIAVTAGARVEDRSLALSAGFQLHMAKPIDPAELTAVIAHILHDKADRC
jgi:CheY-like chemotaxis protein